MILRIVDDTFPIHQVDHLNVIAKKLTESESAE